MDSDFEKDIGEELTSLENGNSDNEVRSTIEEVDGGLETIESSENRKYFYTEIMSTAGPRKNFNEDAHDGDYDLGEDVVGCFTKRNKTFFWLLDGTSDSPILKTRDGNDIFSSRLLAQEVAWNIQKNLLCANSEDLNSEKILKSTFEDIQKSWNEKFVKLSEIDRQSLLNILKEKRQMVVSTTVIFGIIDLDGNLDFSQIGDSFVVTKPTQEFEENSGRLFVIAFGTDDDESIKIELNPFDDTRVKQFKLNNINTLIIATDGISKNTVKWLNIIHSIDFKDENFRKTVSAIRQRTCDDKAMCIIQILEDV